LYTVVKACSIGQLRHHRSGSLMTTPETSNWFEHCVLVYEGPIRSFLRHYFAEGNDIEDCIQETYARLLEMTPEARASVRQWHAFVFITARNVGLNMLRRRQVISLDAVAELEASEVFIDSRLTTFEEVNARQELALLRKAIAALPERCRQVFVLRKVYGLPQREIARQLGISENTVEQHVAKGVRAIARFIFDGQSRRSSASAVEPRRTKDADRIDE
jgi:RNA polymerase sigma factor (sigma-70 family)